jgi:Ca2+-binding RTX toxin-like protein
MNSLQLGNLQYGSVPIYDAVLIRVDNGAGLYTDFRGSFVYAGGGGGGYDPYGYYMAAADPSAYYPISGAITQITEVDNGQVSMDVTGFSADAPGMFNALRDRAMPVVFNALFGGGDQIVGSPLNDWLDGFTGGDIINGGDGADFIRGLEDNDVIDAGPGDDDANGNTGSDVVHGGDGADFVRGGRDGDTVYGDAGDDVHVNGNIGDDLVFGGAGADTLFGGQDQDQLFGEDGDDALSGDLGFDTLTGGPGADRFLIRAGAGADVAADFNAAEGDRVQLFAGQAFVLTVVGGQAVVDLGGGASLTLAGVSQASADWLVFA